MIIVRRLLTATGHALAAAGWMWIGLAGVGPPPPHQPLHRPPDGHPERLCPDVPLTEVEQALERELTRTGPRDGG
ncbi:DUF6059 family protein [Streptomyces sp. cmx-18-6]|uniref:DUF6059 family protein n=1 Tax=Streptomyces sp. cmx-18-6 TaxID=2790930 RepID=UPI00397F642A